MTRDSGEGGTLRILKYIGDIRSIPTEYRWYIVPEGQSSATTLTLPNAWYHITEENFKFSLDNFGSYNANLPQLMNFTGQHRSKIININEDNIENYIGMIVISTGIYNNISEEENIPTIDESLPLVELSTKKKQKNVFGVLSNIEDKNNNKREYSIGNIKSVWNKKEDDNRTFINSLGEGGIWIVNTNGNLENVNYIQSSDIMGYGEKQDSEFLANYTVAKITCDCNFDLKLKKYKCEEFVDELSGNTYIKAFVGCTYHCG